MFAPVDFYYSSYPLPLVPTHNDKGAEYPVDSVSQLYSFFLLAEKQYFNWELRTRCGFFVVLGYLVFSHPMQIRNSGIRKYHLAH